MKRDLKMSNKNQKSKKESVQLKKRLMSSWDQMKVRYPVVRNPEIVKGDSTKEDFLKHIDGLKDAEDIRNYFTLEPSEAHLVFSDLLNLGAIRFLDDAERLGYLKQENMELKKNLDFLISERNKLGGEEFYLSGRIQEKKKIISEVNAMLPELKELLEEHSDKLSGLKESSNQLWESDSELLGIVKDMKNKEQQIRAGLDKLEYEFPKLLKKKSRVSDRLKTVEQKNHQNINRNEKLNKKLLIYQDTVDEMSDYLEDTRLRIKDLVRDEL